VLKFLNKNKTKKMGKLSTLINEMLEEQNNNTQNKTTGKGSGLRFNKGKLRYDLVDPLAHRDMVQVLTDGANKYDAHNWRRGMTWTSIIASLKRHLTAIEMGEDYDPESGRLHISHAACNVHFLNAFYYIFPQGDDRQKAFLNIPKIGLDIDGVLADFLTSWHELYPDVSKEPNSWFFDRNMLDRFDQMRENNTLDEFYLSISPLIKAEDLPFEPHCYITSRPVSNEISERWLDLHNFPKKPVYTVEIRKSKAQIAKEAGVEIFVDDSWSNFVDLNKNDIFTYLFNTSYNDKHSVGHMRISSLNEIPLIKQ
jgi:hypothetical protein